MVKALTNSSKWKNPLPEALARAMRRGKKAGLMGPFLSKRLNWNTEIQDGCNYRKAWLPNCVARPMPP